MAVSLDLQFETESKLNFYLNGSAVTLDLSTVHPDATLLDFIRSQHGLTGTKLGCGEGGCGACTVVIQDRNRHTGKLHHIAVNACLAPLLCIDGKHLITVEGLGNSENPHPLQDRLAQFHGSQCGFCTDGIVMSIYALVRNASVTGSLSIADIEMTGALDGNLCRCTGYKSILDAAKTFVGDYIKDTNIVMEEVPINYEAANLPSNFPDLIEQSGCGKEDCCQLKKAGAAKTKEGAEQGEALKAEKEAAHAGFGGVLKDEGGCGKADCCKVEKAEASCGKENCCRSSKSTRPPYAFAPWFPQFTLKPYKPGTELIYPSALHKHTYKPLSYGDERRVWLRPTTLEQLKQIKQAYPQAKIIGGSSEVQIEVRIKNMHYPVSVYAGDIAELATVNAPTAQSTEFDFGANLSLTDLENYCIEWSRAFPDKAPALTAIFSQLRYFAGRQVRNMATTAGNIATASPISDLNPVWVAIGAQIDVWSPSAGEQTLSIQDDFFFGYRRTKLPADGIITRVRVPLTWSDDPDHVTIIRAYKQAKRRDDDIAIVTCCLLLTVARSTRKIVKASFAYGGMAPFTLLAKKTQASLVGQTFGDPALFAALDVLSAELNLPYGVPGGMPTYRKTLTLSFLYKFWVSVAAELGWEQFVGVSAEAAAAKTSDDSAEDTSSGSGSTTPTTPTTPTDGSDSDLKVSPPVTLTLPDAKIGAGPLTSTDIADITDYIHRHPSSGQRDNSDPYAQNVVGRQIIHQSGLRHTTGEAIYLDDLPVLTYELYGVFVFSTKAHAKLDGVDTEEALAEEGVVAWIDHRDLPNPEANYWGAVFHDDEKFLPTDEVFYHGMPIGMIVAKDKLTAKRGALKVKVRYGEDLPVILTIEEAIAAGSFHEKYDRYIIRAEDGKTDIEDALAASEHQLSGSTRVGGQEHFYLETFCSYVLPRETGEMEVYASSQAIAHTQHWVAQATGVPMNRILVRAKRLGGGFGGKESRTAQHTVVCAMAARKTRLPVRSMLDRDEDMRISGQRHPFLLNWRVGFDSNGKITALAVDVYNNGGFSLDLSGGVADRTISHLDNAYYIPNAHFRARSCKTNTHSNTAYRGFGAPQGMIAAEHYIEAISSFLKMDIDEVRQRNLYREGQLTPYHQPVLDYHVPRLLAECREKSNYDTRKAAVEAFNAAHRWRKRGIALVPTKFGLAYGIAVLNQAGALVHIYLDGSVLVAHGGIEMGQGLHTKTLQIAAEALGVPITNVYVSETSTSTVPNASATAASAGSDLNGYAVHNACEELSKRLAPFREKLGPDASFKAVVDAAYNARVSLSATGFYATPNLGYVWNQQTPSGNLFNYFTQAAICAEVEIDVLTGDSTVLRTDIVMDVGRSLNPAIDYGQIEGAYLQGQGWATMEESLWLRHSGGMFTTGPGAYKIPGFSDIPQEFNVSLLRDAEWPNLNSIKSSKGIGEPPFFLGCAVALAMRQGLKSARADNGVTEEMPLRLPMTSERIRNACADFLVKRGEVKPKDDSEKLFFVYA